MAQEYNDKALTCRDCGGQFVFAAAEQQFFAEKELKNEPKRCNDCRLMMRARRSGKEPELFVVDCADCGQTTKVNFKPTGKKPVLCVRCMHKERTAGKE